MTTITGGCLCGAVKLSISAPPLGARTCWCRLCQHLGAGGPTVNVIFPAEAVGVDGAVSWYESVADSGNRMARGFCPKCGSGVFSKSAALPHLLIVRAGALDDPNLIAPTRSIWTAQAPKGACIDPRSEQFEGQPPPT